MDWPPGPGQVAAPGDHAADTYDEEDVLGWPQTTAWLRRHQVTLGALLLIVVQLVWKARFLHYFYFRQDDFHFSELAVQYGLGWKYLTYVGSGHLHPGVLLLVWIMLKVAPYNWGVASAITLVLVAIASVACWRMLRTLLGDRPAILVPLGLYLVTPLAFPDASWWQSAIETLPLQAALFLAVTSQVHYIRSGRYRHALAAAGWLIVGLAFFEKAVVIPVVLFAVTAGFLVDGRITESARISLVRFWRAWALYAVVVGCYLALLLDTLKSSTVRPTPTSLGTSLTFSWDLISKTLLPGLFGGIWNWSLFPDAAVAVGNASTVMSWLLAMLIIGIVLVTVWSGGRAWRAWAIVAAWLVLADIVPILLGRLATQGFAPLLALDTRYVADAAAIAALGLALAFWPVAGSDPDAQVAGPGHTRRRPRDLLANQAWQAVGLGLVGVVVAGSVFSVHRYEQTTALTNFAGNVFLDNARAALAYQRPGTLIYDGVMPSQVMDSVYYDTIQRRGGTYHVLTFYGYESVALAPLESAATRRNVRWALTFNGTTGNLLYFTRFGTLANAAVRGPSAIANHRCKAARHGRVRLRFPVPPPGLTGILEIEYVAGPPQPGETVTVTYGGAVYRLAVQPGAHNAYFSASGSAPSVTFHVPAGLGFCVNATAGNIDRPLRPQ